MLLLSATPYRMFTTAEDAGGDGHYADLVQTIGFLQHDPERTKAFQGALAAYGRELYRYGQDEGHTLRQARDQVTEMLRRVMGRTERLAVTADRSGMLKEVACQRVEVLDGDIGSFLAVQAIARSLGVPDVTDAGVVEHRAGGSRRPPEQLHGREACREAGVCGRAREPDRGVRGAACSRAEGSVLMAHRYTDVDLLILKRWDEVRHLREAFDDLVDRMADVIESALGKVTVAANERGFSSDYNLKRPSVWFWKPGWATRKGEPGICLEVYDFAPPDYGKEIEDHPSVWLMTAEFSRLKMRETSEEFGRAVKNALSPELQTKWTQAELDQAEYPLGRSCVEVSESDRVHMVAHPEELVRFVLARLDESVELVPAIDHALQQMTRR